MQSKKYPQKRPGVGQAALVLFGKGHSLLTWTEPLGSRWWRSQSWCNGHQQGLTWCCWLLVSD